MDSTFRSMLSLSILVLAMIVTKPGRADFWEAYNRCQIVMNDIASSSHRFETCDSCYLSWGDFNWGGIAMTYNGKIADGQSCATHGATNGYTNFLWNEPNSCSGTATWKNSGKSDNPRGAPLCLATQKNAGSKCDGSTPNAMEGNPCDAGTGNKFQTEVDFESSFLRFERYYNSLFDTSAGSIGKHWSHRYSSSLVIGPNKIEIKRPTGQALVFDKAALTSDPDVFDTLKPVGSNWEYKTTDNTVETYDSTGKLIALRRLDGLTTTLGYVNSQLDTVTGPDGRQLKFNYGPGGKLQTLTFPNGQDQMTYRYTGETLTAVDYPAEGGGVETRQYHYEDTNHPHALTAITDETGVKYAEWQYFGDGRAKQSKHFGGAGQVDFVFNSDHTVVTDAIGKERTYTFEVHHGVVKPKTIADQYTALNQPKTIQKSYTYTATGQVATETDYNNHITQYEYYTDAARNGLLKLRTDAFSTNLARVTTYDWHPDHRAPTRITEPTRETTLSYTGPNCSQGGRFNLCRRTVTDRTTGKQRLWNYTYTHETDNTLPGLLETVDGPRIDQADITTYHYYPNGDLRKVINAKGHETEITQYDGNGRIKTLRDPRGHVTTLNYDLRGRLTSRTVAGIIGNTYHTTYEYYPNGLIKRITPPAGDYLAFAYDRAQRLVSITNAVGDQVIYQLDKMGNRTLEATVSALDAVTDAESVSASALAQVAKRLLKREFNELGRMKLRMDGAGQLRRYAYDGNGNLKARSDPRKTGADPIAALQLDPKMMDQSLVYDYDALDRLITETRIRSGETGNDVITRYDYTPLDHIATVTDANNLQTMYDYNGWGDLETMTSPDTEITTYRYDAAGNRLTQTDARSVLTTYRYDALNRLTEIDYVDDTLDVMYEYDGCASQSGSGPCAFYDRGYLTGMTDQSGETQYTYMTLGQVKEMRPRLDNAVSERIRSHYDGSGRKVIQEYPSGRFVYYMRDAAGRVTGVWVIMMGRDVTKLAGDFEYAPFGGVKGFTYGHGLKYEAAYDKSYRITRSVVLDELSTRNRTYSGALLLEYDETDNLKQMESWISAMATDYFGKDFDYDAMNRLSSADGMYMGRYAYQYDDVGNRTQRTKNDEIDSYFYRPQTHHLDEVSGPNGLNFDYDEAGNTRMRGTRQLMFGEDGRLHQVVEGGSLQGMYTYNGKGQRVKKETRQGVTYFFYDAEGRLIAESNGMGGVNREYIYLHGKMLAVTTPDPLAEMTFLINRGLSTFISGEQVSLSWYGMRGNAGAYEYRLSIKTADQSSFSELQGWSQLTSYTWDSTGKLGINTLRLEGRNAGSQDSPVVKALEIGVNPVEGAVESVSTFRDPDTQPYANGSLVWFWGSATGGSGQYEYRFEIRMPDEAGQAYTVIKDWSPEFYTNWTASGSGSGQMRLSVRNAGSQEIPVIGYQTFSIN